MEYINPYTGGPTLPTMACHRRCDGTGTTLPLITYHLMRRGFGEMSIGAVYAANTIGGIAGVFFAVHLGFPFLGLKNLLTLGSGLDIALGVLLLWSGAAAFGRRRVPAALTAGGALALSLVLGLIHLDARKMASGVYRLGQLESEEVFFQRDGKTATVSVTGNVLCGHRTAASSRHSRGVSVAGSRCSPLTMASSWVQDRGTASTRAYPPPPVAIHRPSQSSSARSRRAR